MTEIPIFKSPHACAKLFQKPTGDGVFNGDCKELVARMPDNCVDLSLSSPPYCIGKEYESTTDLHDFISEQRLILPEIARVTKRGGSICWEIGYNVKDGVSFPLDYFIYGILKSAPDIFLRNRIIWTYGHGMHARKRFSGRHEIVLWFTKGAEYYFDLDAVRQPQKYPGKRNYKGPNRGQLSGNPKGKNPSDVWSIPNVNARHIEKLGHPCQFPVGLAERFVRALCPPGGLVFDPYMGSASSGVAAILNQRRFVGAEIKREYLTLARNRLKEAYAGTVGYRPPDRPIFVPDPKSAVATRPTHFWEASDA